MELLQTITKLLNTEESCPFKIKKCELLYNEEKMRVFLRLTLDAAADLYEDIKVDIGCYDKSGRILSVMQKVPYVKGGMLVELPSLITASAGVVVESAKTHDGIVWTASSELPKIMEEAADSDLDKTEVFDAIDSIEIKEDKQPENDIPRTREERREARRRRFEEEEEIRQLIKNDPAEKKKRLITRLIVIAALIALVVGGIFVVKYRSDADTAYRKAMNLYNSGRFEEALPEFDNAEKYIYFGDKKKELYWAMAICNSRGRDFYKAALCFKDLDGYKESFANYRSILDAYSGIISAGKTHTLALKSDGTAIAGGDNQKGQCDVSQWREITEVSAGGEHSVGLDRNRRVLAVGSNEKGQCDVSLWSDIIDISAGDMHTVGVENVGRVVAVGDNTYGQCEVDSWSGVISVSAGSNHTVGLKLDGTVVAIGSNEQGQCNVSDWKDIVYVTAGNGFTAGLTGDGKIVFTGDDTNKISAAKRESRVFSIAAGGYNLLVAYEDGQVKAFGANDRNQGITDLWRSIVAIDGGEHHSIGVAADGKAFAVGGNESGQALVAEWSDIGIPKSTVTIRKGE